MRTADLNTHPGHLARRLQRAHYLLWHRMVSEDITSPQFAVLNGLADRPGSDQRTVGRSAHLDRSTTADVVTRLVRRGLVERVRDPYDGRRNVLRLTPAGRQMHQRLMSATARMNEAILAPLTDEEGAMLLTLMRKVASTVEGLYEQDAAGYEEIR